MSQRTTVGWSFECLDVFLVVIQEARNPVKSQCREGSPGLISLFSCAIWLSGAIEKAIKFR